MITFFKKVLDYNYYIVYIYFIMEIKEKETTLIIKNVPVSIRQRFKVHCAEMDISMKDAILRLMDLEVEKRILYSPIDSAKESKK